MQRIAAVPRKLIKNINPSGDYDLISIYMPGDDPVNLEGKLPEHRINLCFADMDPNRKGYDVICNKFLLKDQQCKEIVDFISKGSKQLYVNCDFGMSRSISVALAICDGLKLPRNIVDWFGFEDVDINKLMAPNSFVYRTILNEFIKKATPYGEFTQL